MTTLKPPIFDSRETKSGFPAYLKKHKYPHEIDTLHKGDFTVSTRIGGEIKRIRKKKHPHDREYNDLIASLYDNRIYEEIDGLDKLYDVNILILEIEPGASFFTSDFQLKHWKSLSLSLELDFNTHIFKTTSFEETAELIYSFWEKEKKGKHYVSPCNKKPRPKSLKDQQMYLLSGLEGLGDAKTQELLDHFHTPYNVFQYIMETEITYTAGGNPRRPKDSPSGFGPYFFIKNQRILGDDADVKTR